MKDNDPTCVYETEGEVEAQQVRSFLEAHGIPCVFHGESLRKTHGLTLDGLGQVAIHVPEEFCRRSQGASGKGRRRRVEPRSGRRGAGRRVGS